MPCPWLKTEHEKIVGVAIDSLNRIRIPRNAVVVFDIDHTLLDGFGKPIEPVLYLFHFVKQKGIIPVIITARPGYDKNIEWTKQQLKYYGINDVSMYFIPVDKTDPWSYKHSARKHIHEKGYVVIMSIGDEQWDIGEYGGIGIKVPKCKCDYLAPGNGTSISTLTNTRNTTV